MKKRTHQILFILLLLMSCITARAHDIEVANSDGVTIYYLWMNDKTELAVTYRGSSYGTYSGSVVIPESVTYGGQTYPVTSIGEYAFYGCIDLTAVTIGSGVTNIGERAISACRGLTSMTVDSGNANYDSRDNCNAIIETATNTLIAGCKNTIIPNSVTSIGSRAFSNCSGLTSVTIPNSVTSIGDNAFYGCTGLTAVKIPNSVTSIGDYAFRGCTGLTSVEIPNSVTSIGKFAFAVCTGLTAITIPNRVITIGESTFAGCSGLTAISVASGNPNYDSREGCNAIIETATNTLIAGCKNTVIPNSVTTIYAAFYECTDLTFIEIPNSVTSIGRSAFADCSGLTSVTIPNSVTSIGVWAFSYCSGLSSIEIPNSVTSIGQNAFQSCTGLTSVTIPNSVTSIGVSVFYDCTGLTSVTIPNSVTSIGMFAFQNCTGLTSVTIPNSVTSIGDYAFNHCTGLTKIKCLAQTPPTCGDNVFNNVPSTCVLEVPAGTKDAYAAANGWSDFTNIVEVQDIEPAEEDVTVSFDNDINEETNLTDNVVNNTYYNLNSTNGDGYDATEQGIVLNSTTSADDLEAIAGLDISDEAVSANYHGLIIQVAAGSGTISVDVKTIGSYILNVKIGDGVPTQISKSERGTVAVPYNVSEPTYVYIYATSSNGASAPLHRVYRAPSANANSVILYGYGIKLDDTTAIDTLSGEQEALTDDCKIFTLGGQQVNELQPGMNIVRMKNGTVKKVFIK